MNERRQSAWNVLRDLAQKLETTAFQLRKQADELEHVDAHGEKLTDFEGGCHEALWRVK